MLTNRSGLTARQLNEFLLCNAYCQDDTRLPMDILLIFISDSLLDNIKSAQFKEAEKIMTFQFPSSFFSTTSLQLGLKLINQSVGNLSPRMRSLLSSESKQIIAKIETQVKEFLQLVVQDKQKECEDILENNPERLIPLLTWKALVNDGANRKIFGTALQIALGSDAVKFHKHKECMAEMLIRYLKTINNGTNEIANQIQEQFPNGWSEIGKNKVYADIVSLTKTINALGILTITINEGMVYISDIKISKALENHCIKALQDCEAYLNSKIDNKILMTGMHFDILLARYIIELSCQSSRQFHSVYMHTKYIKEYDYYSRDYRFKLRHLTAEEKIWLSYLEKNAVTFSSFLNELFAKVISYAPATYQNLVFAIEKKHELQGKVYSEHGHMSVAFYKFNRDVAEKLNNRQHLINKYSPQIDEEKEKKSCLVM
jgi:hypothetical protein